MWTRTTLIIPHFLCFSCVSLLYDSKVIYVKKLFLKYKNKQILLCHVTKFILTLYTRELYIQFVKC